MPALQIRLNGELRQAWPGREPAGYGNAQLSGGTLNGQTVGIMRTYGKGRARANRDSKNRPVMHWIYFFYGDEFYGICTGERWPEKFVLTT